MAALVLVLLTHVPLARPAGASGRVRIRVVDSTGKPVAGALLIHQAAGSPVTTYWPKRRRGKRRTGSRGSVTLKLAAGQRVNIKAYREGYTTGSVPGYKVPAKGPDKPVVITIRKLCTITGTVVEKVGKKTVPVPRANIAVLIDDVPSLTDNIEFLPLLARAVACGPKGRFTLTGVPPGGVPILVVGPEFGPWYQVVKDLKPGKTLNLGECVLTRRATCRRKGKLVPGPRKIDPKRTLIQICVPVTVSRQNVYRGGYFAETRPAPNLSFHMRYAPAQKAVYFVSWADRKIGKGVVLASGVFPAAAGAVETVDIVFPVGGGLRGEVVAANGNPPFVNVKVSATPVILVRSRYRDPKSTIDFAQYTFAGDGGSYRFSDLPPGLYYVRAHGAGPAVGQFVRVESGRATGPVKLQLYEEMAVKVTVTGKNVVFAHALSAIAAIRTEGHLGYEPMGDWLHVGSIPKTGKGTLKNLPRAPVVVGVKFFAGMDYEVYKFQHAKPAPGKKPVEINIKVVEGVTVTGNVVLKQNGKAVATGRLNVQFLARDNFVSVDTREDGSFVIRHLQPDTYSIAIMDPDSELRGEPELRMLKQTLAVKGDEKTVEVVINVDMTPKNDKSSEPK